MAWFDTYSCSKALSSYQKELLESFDEETFNSFLLQEFSHEVYTTKLNIVDGVELLEKYLNRQEKQL